MDKLLHMPVLPVLRIPKIELLFVAFLLLFCSAQWWLPQLDGQAGLLDQGIWQLILLSLMSFMLLLALCWWILKLCWTKLGLVPLANMVLQFHTLQLWQQLAFYLASFALLLWAGATSLGAIF